MDTNLVSQHLTLDKAIENFKNEWNNNEFKYIVIPYFLKNEFLSILYNQIVKLQDDKWYDVCGIRNSKYEAKCIPQNKKRTSDNIKEAHKAFENNEFSYHFKRSMMNISAEYTLIERTIRILFQSEGMMNWVRSITGINITTMKQLFLSKYSSGNYLAPHSDIGNGSIAFTLQLSVDWLPQYGGLLHFLSEDRRNIIKTITPIMNSLVLFYVPPGKGIPHFVSQVSNQCKKSRYTITGWYE